MDIEEVFWEIKDRCCFGRDCEYCRFDTDENKEPGGCGENIFRIYRFKPDEFFKFCSECDVDTKQLFSEVE